MLSRSVMSDSVTPWTVAHQAPLSMGFPRQEYWSGLPFPPPGDLPNPGIEPISPELADGFYTTEPHQSTYLHSNEKISLYLAMFDRNKYITINQKLKVQL